MLMCVVFVIDQTHVHTNDRLSLSVQYQIFTQVIVLMCVVFVIDQTHVHTNDCFSLSLQNQVCLQVVKQGLFWWF